MYMYLISLSMTFERSSMLEKYMWIPHNHVMSYRKSCNKSYKVYKGFPSLLLLHPEKQLKDINLEHYTILACEPLHDLKCHLLNLFKELPSVLPSCNLECVQCIEKCLLREKKKAAELLATAIQVYQNLQISSLQIRLESKGTCRIYCKNLRNYIC